MQWEIEYRLDDTFNKTQRQKNEGDIGESTFIRLQKKAYNRCPCLRCGQKATCQQACSDFTKYVG